MQTETTKQVHAVCAQNRRSKVTDLTLCGIFAAIICVFTMFIQIQIIPAEGGMVHLGNVPLFFAAAFFGKKVGAVAGGIGMMLSDLLTGWAIYAPLTLIVVALMGLVFGLIVREKPSFLNLMAAVLAVLVIKVAGYYIGEVIVYQSFTVPVASIPGNIIQIITGAIIAVPLILVTGTAVSHLIKNNKE